MIELRNLNKTYHLKNKDVEACKNVNITINAGEVYGIIGYSGAGKSSLVRCINLLEVPDSGEVVVNGESLATTVDGKIKVVDSKTLRKARSKIGMIFQHFNLLDRSTVAENIAYPLKYTGKSRKEINAKVDELLKLVDLEDKKYVYPSQLSGGQKQRVAIARALANNPAVLLSDEATSALDPDATESILELLKKLNKELGLTIVIITHEMAVIKAICDRVAVMEDGYVVEEGDVYDIFANPKANITKKFMASTSSLGKLTKLIDTHSSLVSTKPGEFLVELQFGKDAIGDALISQVSRDYKLNVSIVLANVEMLQGIPFGRMVAIVDGEKENINKALKFIESNHVVVKILKEGAGE